MTVKSLTGGLMAGTLAALLAGSPAFAQLATKKKDVQQIAPTPIVFTSPDGRIYKTTTAVAVTPTGYKLDKQKLDEKGDDGRPRSQDRFWTVILTNMKDYVKVIGKECDAEYLSFHVQIVGDKRLAYLTGTHASCKKKKFAEGTVYTCPDNPSLLGVVWAGDKQPDKCPVPKAPELVTDQKKS